MSQQAPAGSRVRWGAGVATLLVAAVIASLTLVPAGMAPEARRVSFFCLLGCGNQGLRDLISNVLLFVPAGWVACYWLRPSRGLLLCLAATAAIEGLQATVIPGRDSSLRDILSNTAGGGLGIWLFHHGRALWWPDPRRAGRLALWSGALAIGLLAATAIGLRPAPTDRPWYGQWRPDFANFVRYPGTLLDVDLNGVRPGETRLTEPVPARQAMRDGHPWVQVRAISGPQPRSTAIIFAVTDRDESEMLSLAQDRIALLLHLRSRFEAWGLRELIARQPLFPGREPGDTITVAAGLAGRALTIRTTSGTGELTTTLPLTVGLGWSALMPFRYPVYNEWVLFNAVWLAGLILPAGYWVARWAPAGGVLLLLTVVGSGLWLVPLLLGAARSPPTEWLGAAAGALLGWSAGMLSRRRTSPGEA